MTTTRECHAASCAASRLCQRQYEKGEHHLGRAALGLTPQRSAPRRSRRGINSTYLGDAPAALPWIEQAMRIDPFSAKPLRDRLGEGALCSRSPERGHRHDHLQRAVRNDYVHHLWLATCKASK